MSVELLLGGGQPQPPFVPAKPVRPASRHPADGCDSELAPISDSRGRFRPMSGICQRAHITYPVQTFRAYRH
jgi:hypothetical protein